MGPDQMETWVKDGERAIMVAGPHARPRLWGEDGTELDWVAEMEKNGWRRV